MLDPTKAAYYLVMNALKVKKPKPEFFSIQKYHLFSTHKFRRFPRRHGRWSCYATFPEPLPPCPFFSIYSKQFFSQISWCFAIPITLHKTKQCNKKNRNHLGSEIYIQNRFNLTPSLIGLTFILVFFITNNIRTLKCSVKWHLYLK